MKPHLKHYGDSDGQRLLSYNGILNIVLSNRNFGKTWAFKRRAVRRAFKHGKKTIWIRMFRKEVKEACDTFFSSKDLQEYIGIQLYDPNTKEGNIRQNGNTFYYRRGKRWIWFLKVYALSEADAVRSADDVDVDTIVFDEFTKTIDKYKRFRGSIVNNFIDILFSSKREHQIRCILLGNKESVSNPFFTYFGIKPLPASYEGIKVYKEGAIVVQQINNLPQKQDEYEAKMKAMLEGTQYGNYIYQSDYKTQNKFKARKTPTEATIYCQLYIDHNSIKISVHNGFFYVNMKIDNTRKVYCDNIGHIYKNELQLVRRQKPFFVAFVNAIADNRVYYDSPQTYEALQPFMVWLSV